MLFAGNLLLHPCAQDLPPDAVRVAGKLTQTNRVMRDTFWIGVYPGMSNDMIDFMAETIKKALDNNHKKADRTYNYHMY